MMDEPNLPTIVIDSSGQLWRDERAIESVDIAQEIFENLHLDEKGRWVSKTGADPLRVEPYDRPLVIDSLDLSGDSLLLKGFYGLDFQASPSSLCLDDWDRFHGTTDNQLPFVLSPQAQDQLFMAADSYGDDWISIHGKTYPTPSLYQENASVETPSFWQKRYETADTPWDLGEPSPALVDVLKRLKLPRLRVAVLGCGSGEDAAYFAQQGHLVTGFDFSSEAIRIAKGRHKALPNLTFMEADVFELPKAYSKNFDLVFEHTCLAAISPQRRKDLVSVWRKILEPSGALLGVFFLLAKRAGPPFGITEWEVKKLTEKFFEPLIWSRKIQSDPARSGLELVVYSQLRKENH